MIVEIGDKTYAIEIKSGVVDTGDAKKLERFLEYKKSITGLYIVCLSSPLKKIGKVTVCELSHFIKDIGL